MADLLFPIIIILIMYLLIEAIEDALTLMMLAVLFFPISILFAQSISSGGYNQLFFTNVTSGFSLTLFALTMFTIPLFCVLKILWVRHNIKKSRSIDAGET